VTGEPVTENIAGRLRPTLVTVPVPPDADTVTVFVVVLKLTDALPEPAKRIVSLFDPAENCVVPAEFAMFLKMFCDDPRSVFVIVSVPLLVIGLPLTEIPLPAEAATLVTVPVFAVAPEAMPSSFVLSSEDMKPATLVVATPCAVPVAPTCPAAAKSVEAEVAAVPSPKLVRAFAAVVAPVPPFATASVPASVTAPVVPVEGVRPVVPAEKELTPPPVPDEADVTRPLASTVTVALV